MTSRYGLLLDYLVFEKFQRQVSVKHQETIVQSLARLIISYQSRILKLSRRFKGKKDKSSVDGHDEI